MFQYAAFDRIRRDPTGLSDQFWNFIDTDVVGSSLMRVGQEINEQFLNRVEDAFQGCGDFSRAPLKKYQRVKAKVSSLICFCLNEIHFSFMKPKQNETDRSMTITMIATGREHSTFLIL